MHYQAAPNYIAMRNAAKKDGIIISYSNCYRPYQNQIDNWFGNSRPLGERERFVAKPNFSGGKKYGTREEVIATTSNHGFGKAIDVSYYVSRGVGTQTDEDNAQKWINMNGDRFGWYWGDAPDEDWHFVYVG
jgi:LAS superfamily LD-carboxypeptidase LdcB